MKITKISNRSIMFTVPEDPTGIVNMNLILGEHNNFIIDTGTGESNVKAILEYIGNDQKPVIAINTHAHWDHVFGNSALKGHIIVSHVLCRAAMDKNWDADVKALLEGNADYVDAELHKYLPNVVFEGNLHFPEDGISLFHTPGHSDDGISIYDAVDKTLYVGDNFGVFDGVAKIWSDDKNAAKDFIEKYKQYDFVTCIPSHCNPQTKSVISLLDVALAKQWK